MKLNLDPAHELDLSVFRGVMKALAEQGMDGFGPVFQLLLNEAMKVERSEHLNARPYERTDDRRGHANGFKPKSLMTRSGVLDLSIPQVRDSSFCPQALEKGSRSEVAQFRERSLAGTCCRYVYIDATYQRIRYAGAVRNLAVLVAIGINPEGRRELIGVSVSLSEAATGVSSSQPWSSAGFWEWVYS